MINRYSEDCAANRLLANCSICHKLSPLEAIRCRRCGSKLFIRIPNSIQTTLSFVLTAMLLYIPANTFPIMTTELLGEKSHSTIIGGVVLFLEHESYFIAFVIFTASVIVPVAKMFSILWLCFAATKLEKLNFHELTRTYRLTELVGKWSMIDIYVVAILVALIQVGDLMSIQSGVATGAFTGVVILTMIGAQKFDVRLIWDRLERQ